MVSIVVPVYNGEKHLPRCISSLANQTETAIEIIIINDGSTDGSLGIAEYLSEADSRIKVYTQENQGVSSARNLGIEKASGTHICFADCDDYVEPNMIREMLAASADETLVVCNFVHNGSAEKILANLSDIHLRCLDEQLAEAYFTGPLGRGIAFSVWNKLFSLEVIWEKSIRFLPGVQVGEDMLFVFQYLLHCKQIRFIDEGLYHYCISNTSAMNAGCKNYLPAYCSTFQELRNVTLHDGKLSHRILSDWAVEVFTIILTNGYVINMPYRKFADYYKELQASELYQYASRSKRKDNVKRMMIIRAFQWKSKALLFALVKLNSLSVRKRG